MIAQPVIQLFGRRPMSKDKPFKDLMKRLVLGRSEPRIVAPAADVRKDPVLLLLLADQELVEGREEQATYLVEAAYDFFDRNVTKTILRQCVAN